ncbi:TetR family transcriptional regulator [Streptomyces sp. NPDC085932]|uniref:TetR family transcriptional regulator n=1 Tax=Streptomyces sp. NPDC085932 TaxID=3365741 RepID=UPI0037D92FCD
MVAAHPVVEPPPPPRLAWRIQMRERVLEEAWTLAARNGWDRVRVADLAERAEVSRPSIYKEFGDRAGIGQALVERETERFLTRLAAVLDSDRDGFASALRRGVTHTLDEGSRNPFIRAVLTAARGGTDALLPFLTSRPDPVFSSARDLLNAWLSEAVPEVGRRQRDEAADLAVRLTLSHMLLPVTGQGDVPERVTRAVCAVLGVPPVPVDGARRGAPPRSAEQNRRAQEGG